MVAKLTLSKQFNPTIAHPLYLIRNRLLKSLKKYIPELEGKVLDFGCGIKPYESLFNVSEYIGVDYAGEGETYTKEKVDFLYDGHSLPFKDATFDGIFTSEVAEHVFNFEEIIKELVRVLKPGGKILITCPFAMPEHEMPNDFARYTSFAMNDILKRNKLKVLSYEKTGNFLEAIFQLRIIFWDQNIIYPIRKIPILRSVVRFIVFGSFNITAIILSYIFSSNKNLYLNNIILAQKSDQ